MVGKLMNLNKKTDDYVSAKITPFLFTVITIFILSSFAQTKKLPINKNNLIGAYGGDEETENAYFGIFQDSIYYPDSDIWEQYELKGDTIIITNLDNKKEKNLILKLSTDSLVIYDLDFKIERHLNRRN